MYLLKYSSKTKTCKLFIGFNYLSSKRVKSYTNRTTIHKSTSKELMTYNQRRFKVKIKGKVEKNEEFKSV